MRSLKLNLACSIALMLVVCSPSFGGVIYDNLGAQPADFSPSGTYNGGIDLAQRFFVGPGNSVDYTSSSYLHGFGAAWTTMYGTAFMMQLVFDDNTSSLTSATLFVGNDPNGDVGFPTLGIYSDVFSETDPFGPGPEPGSLLGALATDTGNPFPTSGLTNVAFTGSVNLSVGGNYWLVLSSPGPQFDEFGEQISSGVETEWAYTGVPEPATLALVGSALVLLSLRRKRL